jgi:hypothetical protein
MHVLSMMIDESIVASEYASNDLLIPGAILKVSALPSPPHRATSSLRIRNGHQEIISIHVNRSQLLRPSHSLQHVRVGSGVAVDVGWLYGAGKQRAVQLHPRFATAPSRFAEASSRFAEASSRM